MQKYETKYTNIKQLESEEDKDIQECGEQNEKDIVC